jgi:hypothetical protein
MANQDTPFGLKPVRNRSGDIRINKYYVPASYATALFVGDPVVKTGTSNPLTTVTDVNAYEAGTLPVVNKATAGSTNPITGVIVGIEPNPDNLNRALNFRPASEEAVLLVADNPEEEFEIQDDGVVALTVDDIGLNANLIYTNAGSEFTGSSGAELNSSTVAVTAAFQLKIKRLVARPDNELGANGKYLVTINNHTESTGTAGI